MRPVELHFEDGTARVTGDLTFSTVRTLFDRMGGIARSNGMPGTIDLAEVRQIDSAGLALLLEWQSVYRKKSGAQSMMRIENPPEALLKIARLCDAEHYLAGSEGDQAPGGEAP